MRLPTRAKDLTDLAVHLVEDCSVSMGQRQAAYRQYGQWIETGRNAGSLSIANLMYGHLDRTASHLFSPSELRSAISFERLYGQIWQDKGAAVARVISNEWETHNIDLLFARGVREALGYGAYLLKQLGGMDKKGKPIFRGARLVPPWRFGVYNEALNMLDEQEAMLETCYLNRHEVWRRVRNLPDAEKLYKRIMGSSQKAAGLATPTSFMHQVLSTAVLNTSLQNMTQPQPGGIVQLTNDPNFALLGPVVAPELFAMHELYVQDDDRAGDWTTIQLIEPDILIAPAPLAGGGTLKHCDLFAPEVNPYTLIQLNDVQDYLWGRSEITDLMMLQDWLTTHLDDIKRMVGLQIDKIMGFEGVDAITDEIYAQMTRVPGTVTVPQGGKFHDLTPQISPELASTIVELILKLMDRASGFPPTVAGYGEQGVRAGVHADTLVKTGSPRLRDRSLIAERQCNQALDTTLSFFEAKDARAYWTDPEIGTTDFMINQLHEDRRIHVDSHSSSPIYHDDHAQLLAWGVKAGIVDGQSAIEELPFSHKDVLIARWKQKQEFERKLLEQYGPEVLTGHRSSSHRAA